MTDIKEQKYCDICGSPKVWCMCDNSIGEPTIQSLASALTIAKMTVAYQRELILKLSKPSPSDVSVTQDVSIDIKTPQSIENTNPDYYNHAETSSDNNKCMWVMVEDPDIDLWCTSCGEEFHLEADKPSDNHMKYCCYCGKEIAEGE